ncbi:MAG: TRAM domain-containing protein, partial [Nanoarchaeota archaeon]
KWINWSGFVLVDEFCKNNTLTGRNYAYKPVILRGDFKLGDCVYVKIIDATSFDLRAEVLNEIENPLKVFK